MKQLLCLVFLIPLQFSFAQQQTEQEYKQLIIDGHYAFNFYGDERTIRLWAEAESYVEYDAQGNELGNGRYLNINNESFLDPETIGQYSLINGSIRFEVIELNQQGAVVQFFLSDGESESIYLTKL